MMTKFEPVLSKSKLVLQVNTSLYPVLRWTDELEVSFEAEVNEAGQVNLSAAYSGKLNIYVEKLKSNDQFIDRVVERRLDIQRYPLIRTQLVSLSEQEPNTYQAVGSVTFHGVTQQITGLMQIRPVDDKHLSIAGEVTIDVRNFNIEPPVMMAFKSDPMITMTLVLVLKRPD